MSSISQLEPRLMWEIFDAITRVPRPSKKEAKIIAYLEEFASSHGIQYKKDAIGNIVMLRPASPGMENRPSVVLQSHMDMVCEKNSDTEFDFDNDPIQTHIEDGWVKANGTTLGSDDGIGMAAAMALLIDADLEVPAIEALFTVDEETGLTGAFNLGDDMLTGKYLINLDSEDEGEIFIGCAGGVDTLAYFDHKTETTPSDMNFFRLDVSGLTGGHSGDDIEKGYANANKLLARLLWVGLTESGLRLSKIDGGNLRNAIPREGYAIFGVPSDRASELTVKFEELAKGIKEQFRITEPNMNIVLSQAPAEKSVLDANTQYGLIFALHGVPNGVLGMSAAMPGLVETSTNLASVKIKDGQIVVTSSQRSSSNSAKADAATSVRSVYELAGARVENSDGYPGWNPDPSSKLLTVAKKAYADLFGTQPIVRAIHAGLECGLFLQKYPHLEMISIGPTVKGAHSPDERLEISTVDKFWKLLLEILKAVE